MRESGVGAAINALWLAPEEPLVRSLADRARLEPAARARVTARALDLVERVRAASSSGSSLDAFLREYSLASREGVILMCLAEALLRIPDAETADRLIADKITAGDWSDHLGDSESLFVNASTWGLMLTGRVAQVQAESIDSTRNWFGRLASRIGEPVARAALRQSMKILGHQFVMGRSIGEALERAGGKRERAYRYSFDMLGEAALTAADAERYFDKYRAAIGALAAAAAGAKHDGTGGIEAAHSISVKLSALHPRYEFAQRERVLAELTPQLLELARLAREGAIGLTVDAEEADRLELSLELVDAVLTDPVTQGYDGFGLAVQAYQKRAPQVLDWLADRAAALNRKLCVRLVKGAYWDSEVKRAQERGLPSYPVYTRKANTDVAYLACARRLAAAKGVIHPQLATHNAHTVAYVAEVFAAAGAPFEFQRLHGMGEELYEHVVGGEWGDHPCRVYAPVGAHADLLPYLVRRLLENGANTSFVNRLVDASLPAESVVADPVADVDAAVQLSHPRIALPPDLYGAERRNSLGANLADGREVAALHAACARSRAERWHAAPLLADGAPGSAGPTHDIVNPADERDVVGTVTQASAAQVNHALAAALAAHERWDAQGGAARAAMLERAADLMAAERASLVVRCVREAGKSLPDSIAEVREAEDFLRYYAARARAEFEGEASLPGPTGERNVLRLRGRGVFGCISPWNFPVAIYTGQVAAALAAGNAVLAKPAEQTPLCAARVTELLHAAGVPRNVLQFLPGEGAIVGAALAAHDDIAGICFTGSTDTARAIERSMAARKGAIGTLIAETGGVNAMIVDSSALAEHVVLDAVASGFNSAGQRCSALRLLIVQEEIAPRVLDMLAGFMDELVVGDPALLATDVGPVIDSEALGMLETHAAKVSAGARWSHRVTLPASLPPGRFFAPLAVEIGRIEDLEREVFGPIVHVVRYRAEDIDAVVDAVNARGYGLTLGVQTRIDSLAQRIARRARVGNVYVNRNMIGAVVGVQPFGGCGLSGTGPKAGGPHYLHRFATEQTITVNTAAVGGNATLLSLTEQ
jgi:RHH-type proline utilization regulon transcriptional repressor/proline dehydrogenase/delta 1-pyrroline-5-carboxylate dehydrogenase